MPGAATDEAGIGIPSVEVLPSSTRLICVDPIPVVGWTPSCVVTAVGVVAEMPAQRRPLRGLVHESDTDVDGHLAAWWLLGQDDADVRRQRALGATSVAAVVSFGQLVHYTFRCSSGWSMGWDARPFGRRWPRALGGLP